MRFVLTLTLREVFLNNQSNLQKLKQINQNESDLRKQCEVLRNTFKAIYPANICPVYLARQSGLSKTPLFWRYSSKIRGKLGAKVRSGELFILIKHLPQKQIMDLLDIEQRRIELGYELSIVSYTKIRLKKLLEEQALLSKAIKSL